jgi:hypothetical protein
VQVVDHNHTHVAEVRNLSVVVSGDGRDLRSRVLDALWLQDMVRPKADVALIARAFSAEIFAE